VENDLMRILVANVALVAMLTSVVGRAETYSTPINGFAADSSGEFAIGTFDFGLSFSKIESVIVETTMPSGLSGGYCTGSVCSMTSLITILYDPEQSPSFPSIPSMFADPYPSLYGSFNHILPNRPSQSYISPLNPYNGLGSPPFPPQWPDFLLEGRGGIGVQQVTQWSCYLNCDGSGSNVQAPMGFAATRLIVEGAAVPEPSTDLLLCLVVTALCFYQVRNRQPTIC
jgi:hypothetical protein